MSYPTVSEYLVSRLTELGVTEFFGVPGDFNFNVCSAIEASTEARWIGCSNELDAGYAADGYARDQGLWYGRHDLRSGRAVGGQCGRGQLLRVRPGIPHRRHSRHVGAKSTRTSGSISKP